MRILKYLDVWLAFAHSEDVLNKHKHILLLHLESLREHTEDCIMPQLIDDISGGAAGLDESGSLSRAHTRFNVCSRYFQPGKPRGAERISEAFGTTVCHLSLLYMPPTFRFASS